MRAKDVVVCLEIEKRHLQPVFDRNPDAIEPMAAQLVQIDLENERKTQAYKQGQGAEKGREASLVSSLVGKIRGFFATHSGEHAASRAAAPID